MTPLISSTPGNPVSYTPSIAETFSWIPIADAGRPLYARATYVVNPSTISLSGAGGSTTIELSGVENLIRETNTKLNALTSLNLNEFNETQTLIDYLTALQNTKQNQIITLLHQLTANTDEIEINLDNLEVNTDGVETLLDALTSLNQKEFDETQTLLKTLTASNEKVSGFSIPPYDEITLDYYTPTNNLRTVTYKEASTTVLALSFQYINQPPVTDDELLVQVKKI